MPLPPLSRNVRLALAVVWLALLVAIEWVVAIRSVQFSSVFWMRYGLRILGCVLLVLFVRILHRLGFEEESLGTESHNKLRFFIAIVLICLLSAALILIPLTIFFSFLTDSPYVASLLTIGAGGVYFLWSKFRLQRRTV